MQRLQPRLLRKLLIRLPRLTLLVRKQRKDIEKLLKNITALSDKAELPRPGLPAVASPAVLVEGLTVSGS